MIVSRPCAERAHSFIRHSCIAYSAENVFYRSYRCTIFTAPIPCSSGCFLLPRYHKYRGSTARYQLTTTKVVTQYAPFDRLHMKLSVSCCFVMQLNSMFWCQLLMDTTQTVSTAISVLIGTFKHYYSLNYLLNLLTYSCVYFLTIL